MDTSNLPPTLVTNGQNIAAVEIHQQALSSSDVSFDFQLQGVATTGAVRVGMRPFGAQFVLTWTAPGYLLEQADAVTGPWTFLASESPVTVSVGPPQRFFRLRKP